MSLALALGSCDGSSSDDTDVLGDDAASQEDVVEAWAEVMCADQPTERDDVGDLEGVTVAYGCSTDDPAQDDDQEGTLFFFDSDDAAAAYAGGEAADCDVPYSVALGASWVSVVDDSGDVEQLERRGAEVLCEGM